MHARGRTFVGFGFGPIQSALFLREAFRSGNFSRLVVSEVLSDTVRALRDSGGDFSINIAGRAGIAQESVTGVEIFNPARPDDRRAIVAAVAEADEMATCLPGVQFFDAGDSTSVARILAEGLAARTGARPVLLYAAENHNHAAEILNRKVAGHFPGLAAVPYQALNTVIGKMSGVIEDPERIRSLKLAAITPSLRRAVLVEDFNRILVSRVIIPGAVRGISAFEEKDDLLPFEEAKLYGHNAVHALIGYLAQLRGMHVMSEAAADAEIMRIAREAFVMESGAALVRRHAGLGDRLFTPDGYRAYAEDLLDRMTRPTLNDMVDRICRDPARKLGYDDRLFGTMRLALAAGIQPVNMAIGAAAALAALSRDGNASGEAASESQVLHRVWGRRADRESEALVALTVRGFSELRQLGFAP